MSIITSPDEINKIVALSVNVRIEIKYNSIIYNLYFKAGKLIYASHSVAQSERLERHLKRLNHLIPEIHKNIRSQALIKFEEITQKYNNATPEYLTIIWLLKKDLINKKSVNILLSFLIKEVVESYLLIAESPQCKLRKDEHKLPFISQVDWLHIVKKCEINIKHWINLSPKIKSPLQRPYFFKIDSKSAQINLKKQKQLAALLKGFNFFQLAAILNQDELIIAKKLYPLIVSKAIVLRDAQTPFDKLPTLDNFLQNKVKEKEVQKIEKTKIQVINKPSKEVEVEDKLTLSDFPTIHKLEQNYTIVCVDDSPVILQSITKFLNHDNLTIVPIKNAGKALIMITRIKPNLILMDIGMPRIDGYQLCTLIRKHSNFKDIPIVMVTGNKGLINRAKAKLAGATDYMTKPFSQEDLLKMVFRYLT